ARHPAAAGDQAEARLQPHSAAPSWREDPVSDEINPQHYTRLKPERIDVIESWGLDYHLGTVVKYRSRAGHKGDKRTDLEKARWFLDRAIEAAKPKVDPTAVDVRPKKYRLRKWEDVKKCRPGCYAEDSSFWRELPKEVNSRA